MNGRASLHYNGQTLAGPALTVTCGGSGGSGGTSVGTRAGDLLIANSTADAVLGIPSSSCSFCLDLQRWASSPNLATLGSMESWDLCPRVETYQRLGASHLANQCFATHPARASDAVAANYEVANWELLYGRGAGESCGRELDAPYLRA